MDSRSISHYRIISKLGVGGMGEVFLAEDTKLDRKVAIKMLPATSIGDDHAKKRLIREAKAAATLDHSNICSIYEVGEEGDCTFIAMQYIEGGSLAAKIKGNPLPWTEVIDIGIQAADALAEAHSRGVIHRDIKPQNVIITPRGQVKILDFGLAKLQDERPALDPDAPTLTRLTETGTVLGTPGYMSPEQLKGQPVDARTDLFSLGVMLYECATGNYAFSGSNAVARALQVVNEHPPSPSEVNASIPLALARIIVKAMAKEVDARYNSASAMQADLLRVRAELQEAGSNKTQPMALPPRPSRWRVVFFALALAMALALAVAIYFWRTGSVEQTASGLKSVAVLPFKPLISNQRDEFLELGMADALITKLSNIRKIIVRPTSAVLKYRDGNEDPLIAGREQGVDALLDGRVQRSGDRIRVTVQLLRVSDGKPIWAETFDERSTESIFSVQDSISQQVARALVPKLTGEEQERLAKRYTDNTEAYNLYLKGRFFWSRFNQDGLEKAIEYFNQAIAIDPDYALAYTGLANAYNVQGSIGIVSPAQTWPKAKLAAEKAVALDDTLSKSHQALGGIKLMYEWDWAGAEKELARAIELSPADADPHNLYAYYYQTTGQLDRAISELRRAQELAPLSLVINADLASALYFQGNYEEAMKVYRKGEEIDPHFGPPPLFLPAQIYERSGEYDRAIAECEKAFPIFGRDPGILSVLGYAYAVSGKRREAQTILAEIESLWKRRYFSPIDVALVYAGLGDKNGAFRWLTKAYEARDPQLIWLKVEPQFENLRSDPRFNELLRRMNLAN